MVFKSLSGMIRRMVGKKSKIIIIILCIFLTILVIEPTQLDVNEITVQSSDIPTEFNGTRIAVVGDIHYGEYVNENRVSYIVNQTNEQNADIIVLVGDYVTNDENDADTCIKILNNLHAKYGVYGILGNNDPKNKTSELLDESTTITNIRNNGVWIEKNGARIRLGGVGDISTDLQYPRRTTNGTTENDFVIMAYHNPNYFDLINHSRIDLSLTGHTHGGQINFFGYAPWVQKSSKGNRYISGLYEEDGSQLVVTNGIGERIVPFRFMATPQITIVTLEST